MLFGCVRETLYNMPNVDIVVSWENLRDQTHSDAMFYIYPQFDYLSEMMEIVVAGSEAKNLTLLPGRYKVLMHSYPFAPIVIDNCKSFDQFSASIEYNNASSASLKQFMALSCGDPAKEINVRLGEKNKFEFKPISVSKKICFVIKGDEKFGQVDIVDAVLSGVVSKINLSTMRSEQVGEVKIDKWAVDERTFTSRSVEVLGFDKENKISLNLIIQSPESDYPKEQPIDLTDELRNLEGDEVQITMEVEYKPDIRVRKVSIKEWLAGNEIDIDF